MKHLLLTCLFIIISIIYTAKSAAQAVSTQDSLALVQLFDKKTCVF